MGGVRDLSAHSLVSTPDIVARSLAKAGAGGPQLTTHDFCHSRLTRETLPGQDSV